MKCRSCGHELTDVFLDLGTAPPSNAFVSASSLSAPEVYFPLKLFTCDACHLVQVDEVQSHDSIFNDDYVYFSSYSRSWLEHAKAYVSTAIERLGLGPESLVIEVASNDGYLLQYVRQAGIPCVGIEPTASTAEASRGKGIDTIGEFFTRAFATSFVQSRGHADLMVANNVLAHVPDIHDFVAGFAITLAATGTATFEFPHLLALVEQHQFDTVYHEHFSYLSLHAVERIFTAHDLEIWDVEELPTHGGSLRIWAGHTGARKIASSVVRLRERERVAGMLDMPFYHGFQEKADEVKHRFLRFLLDCRREGKRVGAYGAAAKGNTLINYAGVKPDLLGYIVDASPHKQGRWLPGSRIPVVDIEHLKADRPDYVIILPWNLRSEIINNLAYIRDWGGKFVTFIPDTKID